MLRSFWISMSSTALLAAAAASAAVEPGRVGYLAQGGGFWQVWVMGSDGSGARQVTRSSYEKASCSWFPDGKRLLVNSLAGDLYVVDVETGEEERLQAPAHGMMDASVSPDGRRIAFSLSPAGSIDDNDIFVMDADGSGLVKLTAMEHLQHDPRWSADGRWLYFTSGDGGQAHDLWRIDVGTQAREQLSVGNVYHFDVAVAPDGRLAFSNNRSGNYEIYVQREGGKPQPVTKHAGLDGHPTWSPDGRSLIFHSTRSGSLNLWRLDLGGGKPHQLTEHGAGARSPVWWHPPEGRP